MSISSPLKGVRANLWRPVAGDLAGPGVSRVAASCSTSSGEHRRVEGARALVGVGRVREGVALAARIHASAGGGPTRIVRTSRYSGDAVNPKQSGAFATWLGDLSSDPVRPQVSVLLRA